MSRLWKYSSTSPNSPRTHCRRVYAEPTLRRIAAIFRIRLFAIHLIGVSRKDASTQRFASSVYLLDLLGGALVLDLSKHAVLSVFFMSLNKVAGRLRVVSCEFVDRFFSKSKKTTFHESTRNYTKSTVRQEI